jgi:hypothetical protein
MIREAAHRDARPDEVAIRLCAVSYSAVREDTTGQVTWC